MSGIPNGAEELLSVDPAQFTAERKRVARELREAGRAEDAAAVSALRKPPPVVLAANRAARDQPKLARDAARAAKRLKERPGQSAEARAALDEALASLEGAALAVLGGADASDALRRRLHDLLRNAVADGEALDALLRGVLTEEPEPAGFAAYAGASLAASPSRTDKRTEEAAERKQRAREKAAQREVAAAESRVREAVAAEEEAARARAAAEEELERARKELMELQP